MDNKAEKLLVQSLINRLSENKADGKYYLEGPISDIELSALQHFAGDAWLTDQHPQFQLDLMSLEADPTEDLLMCLDFGTACSKAFATEGTENALVELGLGRSAGEPDYVYPVSSTIYISDDRI